MFLYLTVIHINIKELSWDLFVNIKTLTKKTEHEILKINLHIYSLFLSIYTNDKLVSQMFYSTKKRTWFKCK